MKKYTRHLPPHAVRIACLLLLVPLLGGAAETKSPPAHKSEGLHRSKLLASQDPKVLPKGHEVLTIEGWTVLVSDRLRVDAPADTARALELLEAQLRGILERVPAEAAAYLQTVPLWFSPVYEGFRARAEYHPGAGWLRENGRDKALLKCIEFTNVSIFEKECVRMPVFVLHELAHAYHEQVLGFDDPAIQAAYGKAVASKSYDAVKNHAGKVMRSYAMTNQKEYFAEATEAFFARNDFEPYDRAALKKHDPEIFALLKTIWNGEKTRE